MFHLHQITLKFITMYKINIGIFKISIIYYLFLGMFVGYNIILI